VAHPDIRSEIDQTGILEVRRPKVDRANDPRYNFDADPSLDEIIAQQGKGPITDLSVLHGDFWPEEESIEDFLAALHEWRGHKRAGPAA
jgi:hypothetical protein